MSAAPNLRVVQDPTDGPPPFDFAAEASVLSAVMLDPTAMPKVSDFLRSEQFYIEPHRRIFQACESLARDRQPIDVTTVGSWLQARSWLVEVGGTAGLVHIADSSPALANVRSHAVAVHETWRRRRVIALCQRAIGVGYTSVGDVQKFCDDTVRSIADIGYRNPLRPTETNREVLDRLIAAITAAPAPNMPGDDRVVPTGIHSLDKLIGGVRRKAKTTIAAETGAGKTALALQIALHVARAGMATLFFSTELTREEILARALSQVADVPRDRVKSKTVSASETHAIFDAANAITELPLRIDTTARLTADEVRGIASAFAEESFLLFRRPLGLVVVDYVQRLAPPPRLMQREEREHIAYSTRELKLLAQELDVAMLELAQANRPKTEGGIAVRTISGSSVVAKESDEVIFIVPDPNADPSAERIEVTLDLAKQRDGRRGTVRTLFRGATFKFEDPNAPSAYATPSRQYVDDGIDAVTGQRLARLTDG